MTNFSEKKEAQRVAELRMRLDHAEKLISALVTDMEFVKQRLAKVEVVKAGPQTHDVAGTTFEMQRTETD